MSWPNSILIAVLVAVASAVAGFFIASACVDWYDISGREGASGYFVVFIALGAGMVGFFAGLALSRFVGGAGTAGFFKGLGISMGSTLGLALAVGLVAWLLADIPPTINGHYLNLLVEIRLPIGAARPPADPAGRQYLEFISSKPFSREYRARSQGTLRVAEARQDGQRWIVPGSVYIFTTRGTRSIAIPTGERKAIGFEVEFPGHPDAKYEQWSDWLPRTKGTQPWPDTEISYRYRIEERIPQPEPDPAAVAEAEFKALTPDSPLDKWLSFLKYGMPADREHAIMTVVETRPADLVKLLRPTDSIESHHTVYAVSLLKTVDPQVTQAMRDIATDIAGQIRKFSTMKSDQPGYYELGNDIRNRFKGWSQAWWNVHRVSNIDGRPPVEEILQLAKAQKDSDQMREVTMDAEAHLQGLESPAK